MYFRFQKAGQLLQVDENFAHLKTVLENDDLEFEFIYVVSQKEAISRKATRVLVSVESRQIVKKSLLTNTQVKSNSASLVNNIRSAVQDAKMATITQSQYVLAQRESDITAYVSNDIVAQLSSRMPISQIGSLNRPGLMLATAGSTKDANDVQPILHRIANSMAVPDVNHALTASFNEDPQQLMLDMINRQGLDPSHVINLSSRTSSEQETKGGLTTIMGGVELNTDPASRLLNHYLFPPIYSLPPTLTNQVVDGELVTVLQNLSSDYVAVPVKITIPRRKLTQSGGDVTQVFVKFDLIDSESSLPIDTVTKVLDISQHVRIYYTPKVPPRVKATGSDISTRVNLEIKQVDPGATEVLVYKKSIWIASPEIEDYTLIGTYDLKSTDQSLLVQVDQPRSSPIIYRVISRGLQSMMGFEYSNVALKPARYTPPRAVSLVADQVDNGVKLEIRRIPPKVVAVQFLRLNLTSFEKEYTVINEEIGFISDDVRRLDLVSTIDSGVTPGVTYGYSVRLIYVDGNVEVYGKTIVEFIKPSPGTVDVRVTDLTVDHDSNVPNVSFNINTRTIDTDIDAVKRMLERQGLLSYFTDDILTQRDQLQNLIAHSVKRIDLNTGHVDSFGVLTQADFNDSVLRKNQSIGQLQYGHRYRYEIYPLLRAPETMFDSFVKESIDSVTKKPYRWSPAKFLHPLTLDRGVLVSSAGAKKRYGKDPMAYGIIGSPVNIEVSFDEDAAKIIDPEAAIFDRYLNLVSWKILGNVHRIDHFLIFKEIHGMRTLLGKTHGEFEYGSCQYLHKVQNRDAGALKYVIIPIMNDYKEGPAAMTNTLIVESK